MTEKQLQQGITDMARIYGWRCYHTYNSQRSAKGFPDLVLVRPPRVVFMELKAGKGKLSEDQVLWIGDLNNCDEVSAAVVFDTDYLDGEVERMLR